jgi:excisionase family DNA binding protein
VGDKEFLTLEETINYLGMSRATLYRLMDQGIIKSYRIPGHKKNYYRREEILNLFVPSDYRPKEKPEE